MPRAAPAPLHGPGAYGTFLTAPAGRRRSSPGACPGSTTLALFRPGERVGVARSMLAAKVVFWAAWCLILYTYVLFPLVLAICARRVKSTDQGRDETRDEFPRVAMVVAAHNEARVIAEKLTNSWSLDYPADRFRLVVGSDGSSDNTVEILNACGDPRLQVRRYAQ